MELTAETLLEVLRSLRCDPTSAAMRRRRLPRVGVRLRLKILPFGEGGAGPRMPQPAIVRLRDLSRRGLGFVHSAPLEVGQSFIITLPREAGGHVHMLGQVERCRALEGGSWEIGSSIRTDVPREEIERLLASGRRSA